MADEDSDEREDGQDTDESSSQGAGEQPSHKQLARSLEKQADELEQRSQEVGKQISDTRGEWQRKQAAEDVPGAVGDPEQGHSSGGAEAENEGAPANPASEDGPEDVDDAGQ